MFIEVRSQKLNCNKNSNFQGSKPTARHTFWQFAVRNIDVIQTNLGRVTQPNMLE